MQPELTYFALFVLGAAFLLLTLWRIFRAARNTIYRLNYESRRDRLQHERIEREKRMQARALRRGTRKVNGKAHSINWDRKGRRARRDSHIDEAAHEVFGLASDTRCMDIRTPWGWPESNGGRRPARYRPKPSIASRLRDAASSFFRPKQLVDEQYRARRQQSIRALVEDRYGRVGYGADASEIEWSRPTLPKEYLEERRNDQMVAGKAARRVQIKTNEFKALHLAPDDPQPRAEQKKASGD